MRAGDYDPAAGTAPEPANRLNPFALPVETEGRFNLLILAAVMLAFSLGNALTIWLSDVAGWIPAGDIWDYAHELDTFDAAVETTAYFERVVESLPLLLLPMLIALVAIALAAVIYRTHPARIRRRKQLGPLQREKDARFIDAVADLAKTAGVSPPPSIESGKGSHALDGQAFGFPGHYVLRLGGKLRLLQRKRPATFRAIVLHELGHIVNKDVRRTYLAQALWIATIVLTIFVLIVTTVVLVGNVFIQLFQLGLAGFDWRRLFTVRLPTYITILLQAGSTLLLMTVIRGGVLRVREIYADWRATLWGAAPPLSEILQSGKKQNEKTSLWTRLVRLHPPPQARLDALNDPSRLFRMALDVPFVAGALMSFVLQGAVMVAFNWMLPLARGIELLMLAVVKPLATTYAGILVGIAITAVSIPALLLLILSAFIVPAYLVAGTIGVQLQRDSVTSVLDNRRGYRGYLRLWLPALLMAVGFQIGLLITPLGFLAPMSNPRSWIMLVIMPVWVVFVTGLMWLWLVYARFFALRIISMHTRHTPPVWSRRLLSLALSFLLWALFVPVLAAQSLIAEATLGPTPNPSFPVASVPIALVVVLVTYLSVFIVTWVLVGITRLLRRPACPACGTKPNQPNVLGKTCDNCGYSLSPWLFA